MKWSRLLVASLVMLVARPATAEVAIQSDVVYGHKDGLALTMDVFRPAGESPKPAVLFMVSGGWVSRWVPPQQLLPVLQPYLDAGFTTIAVRHGSSPRYGIPEAVSDVRQAIRYVRAHADQLGIQPDRLGVFGMSAGGHLALMLGTTGAKGDAEAEDELARVSSRVQAVVAFVPPTDLRVAVWEAPESLPIYRGFPALNLDLKRAAEQSPLVHVTPDDAPALMIMGGKDFLVPARHGEWMKAAFEKEKVEHKLIVFPEAGHGLDGGNNQQTAFREAVAWFGKYLRPKPQAEE